MTRTFQNAATCKRNVAIDIFTGMVSPNRATTLDISLLKIKGKSWTFRDDLQREGSDNFQQWQTKYNVPIPNGAVYRNVPSIKTKCVSEAYPPSKTTAKLPERESMIFVTTCFDKSATYFFKELAGDAWTQVHFVMIYFSKSEKRSRHNKTLSILSSVCFVWESNIRSSLFSRKRSRCARCRLHEVRVISVYIGDQLGVPGPSLLALLPTKTGPWSSIHSVTCEEKGSNPFS